MTKMEKEHPHAGATYQVIPQSDGGFGVEVTIPNTHPTMVTGFATAEAATAWAAKHKDGIDAGNSLRRKMLYPQKRS